MQRAHPPVDRARSAAAWAADVTARTWLSVVAAAFVCLALVALAVSPLFTFRRLAAFHAAEVATTHAAAADLVELRMLFAEEVSRHQALRSGDDARAGSLYARLRTGAPRARRAGPDDARPAAPRRARATLARRCT